jgi:hypothetical protein
MADVEADIHTAMLAAVDGGIPLVAAAVGGGREGGGNFGALIAGREHRLQPGFLNPAPV